MQRRLVDSVLVMANAVCCRGEWYPAREYLGLYERGDVEDDGVSSTSLKQTTSRADDLDNFQSARLGQSQNFCANLENVGYILVFV